MGDPSRKFSLPAKFVTAFAMSTLLGFGLCTAGVLQNVESTSKLITFGYACFWVSLVGLVVSLLWLSLHKRRADND
jgi:hypothetical protein